MKYIVKTQDVDGKDRRVYRTRAGAIKRFEEMLGLTFEQAFDDASWAHEAGLPTLPYHQVKRLRAVSKFGTVVEFEERDD